MNHSDITNIILAFIGVVLVPGIVFLFRGMARWIRTEDRLGELVAEVRRMNTDHITAHGNIVDQMSFDRKATNERLRFLEEYFMSHGMRR